MAHSPIIEDLYNRICGDEDARVCKDIPEAACNDQPRNFFAYLCANLMGKIADELASAKLILPWLFGMLGVPVLFTGFVVPIREAGVLLPQLAVAAAVRKRAIRKHIWILGSVLSALSLFGMGFVALQFEGPVAGALLLAMLIIFSLSRGICSVSAKDVLGKTVSKSRRGRLSGWSESLAGISVLAIGLWLSGINLNDSGLAIFAGLLFTGGLFWLFAAVAFNQILEQPGATEGGGNALTVALQHLKLLQTDRPFRQFVIGRTLLLSVALAPPFYVLIAQASAGGTLLGLGTLIIANGLASSLSAPFWGYMSDRSSRQVMILAAWGAGLLGLFTSAAVMADWHWLINEYGLAVIFFILSIMHGGVRLGRKVYLMDMANTETRAAYTAVSNTVIGLMMLVGGLLGLIGDWLGPAAIVFLLSILALLAAVYIYRLPEISEG
ncbi:MFS transporter [Neptuniibacter sp. CAU 1671]|uniref:MFS transporter n=1 Tax=Neptuniibacter sp. CAU 1671 TaxID=3032593 RepID=UPI0023DB1BFE|nr:MFS transporter [Neptuniibacter sp. CAU 1671]MDF2181625.1 MFS transporter [Neptuniibacter sp. CAU 1671]